MGSLLFLISTLVVVMPTRDGMVIIADSKTTSTTNGVTADAGSATKVFTIESIPATAFSVTGSSPFEWTPRGGKPQTLLDVKATLRAALSGAAVVSPEKFFEIAERCREAATRLHRLGPTYTAPFLHRRLFSAIVVRAGTAGKPSEIGSFAVQLTADGADISTRWTQFSAEDPVRVFIYGETGKVPHGLAGWTGQTAACARQFLAAAGTIPVGELDSASAAQTGIWIEQAAFAALGPNGSIGPPFVAYRLGKKLEVLPVASNAECGQNLR